MNRGSTWHKWDLHLHTPFTWINNQYKLSREESKNIPFQFVKKLFETKYFNRSDIFSKCNNQDEYRSYIDGLDHGAYNEIQKKLCIYEIVKRLRKKGIVAVGVTNYFNFNEEDYIFKEILESEGFFCLYNLEFRLDRINKDEQLWDYHVLFDGNLGRDKIKLFLSNLDCNCGIGVVKAEALNTDNIQSAYVDFKKLKETLESPSIDLKDY